MTSIVREVQGCGPLGTLRVEERDGRLWSVSVASGPRRAGRSRPDGSSAAEAADRGLRSFFSGTVRGFDGVRLAERGTAFQREVWAATRALGCGETATYGELAARIDRPKAVRAVGAALGANPWLVIVPCHRVVGADGSLTGFAAGVEAKRWLLDREAGRREPASTLFADVD